MERHRARLSHLGALTALLAEQGAFRSVTQLHNQLQERGHGVGLATVYRLLEAMTKRGDVDRITGKRGEARYRLCSSNGEQHQSLVCTSCDTVLEVDSAELDEWAHTTAAAHGFTDIRLKATVAGTCSRCRNSLPGA